MVSTFTPMLLSLLLVFFLTNIDPISANNKYCSRGSDHVMCLYKPNTYGPECGRQIGKQKLTKADQTLILKLHNDLRRKVAKGLETRGNPGPQPPASNMREMIWDDELALYAQTWANQCTQGHNDNNALGAGEIEGMSVLQNGAYMGLYKLTDAVDLNRAVNMWIKEINPIPKSAIAANRLPSSTGHYRLMLGAQNVKIGCGLTVYYDASAKAPWANFFCNYGYLLFPGTNPVYKVGKAASACPKGTVPSDGLCRLANNRG